MASNPIPIIDLQPLRDGNAALVDQVGRQLRDAFTEHGFAYVANHGLSQGMIDEAFTWSTRFFALPQEDKEKAPHPPEGWWHRGYSGIGREKVVQMVFDRDTIDDLRKVPDFKESFDIGRADDTHTPNIWPPDDVLPGFRDFFTRFYDHCHTVQLNLLRAIAVGMGLDVGFFHVYHRQRQNQIRLLHYPPVKEALLAEGKAERLGAHTDFGTISLLLQDDAGGLEVEDPRERGKFNPVPFVPGTLVVNVADLLQRWSNDILRSTLHRVGAPPLAAGKDDMGERVTRERFSIVYFVGADSDETIDCLPGCFGPGRPKRYEPINSREYVEKRLNATY